MYVTHVTEGIQSSLMLHVVHLVLRSCQQRIKSAINNELALEFIC